MAKKKIIRKSNRTLNLFADGGDIKQTWGQQAKSSAQSAFSGQNLGSTIGGIGSAVGTIVNAGIQNAQIADTSGLEGEIKQGQTYKAQANTNDDLLREWSAFSPMENVSWRDIRGGSTGQRIGNTIGAAGSGASAGATVGGPIGAIVGAVVGLGSAIGGWIGGNKKAKRKANKLNKQIGAANESNLTALENRASSIDTMNDLNALANFSAYGGPINTFDSGAIDYELAKEDLHNKQLSAMSKYKMSSMPNSFETPELAIFAKGGKIHIKKANRGKFTDYCGGKVTSECIARGKRSKSAAVRKRATFAANARKWHHALGGYLYDEGGNLYTSVPNIGQHGGDFSNGVTIIGNGGTHEENPMEGVPMGIASDGTPNLVEQGEVKFNDYVFSNRLFATGGLLAAHNLPTAYADHSFADIAERLSRESSERPNDPISKRGLMSAMTRLQQAQEQLRAEEQNRKYAKGGHLFAGGGPAGINPDLYDEEDNYLIVPTGSKITENPFAYDDAGYQAPVAPVAPVITSSEPPVMAVLNDTKDAGSQPSRTSSRQGRGLSWLRYAPAVGAGLGVLTDALGKTNKPDYGNADLVGSAVDNLTDIEFTPIGNYLTYRPLDRNYYINRLNAEAGATRRAIVNQSGGNRATALAGLLAADYNALGRMGDLARQAEEYNMAQRERVETFNRGTNQFNSEMGLKAAIANKENDKLRLQARIQQAQLRDQADARASAGRAANLTNLFDSLGNIGIDEMNRADRDMLIRAGVFGTLSEKPQGWSDKRWEEYKKSISGEGYSNGGKLKKRRGGLTY